MTVTVRLAHLKSFDIFALYKFDYYYYYYYYYYQLDLYSTNIPDHYSIHTYLLGNKSCKAWSIELGRRIWAMIDQDSWVALIGSWLTVGVWMVQVQAVRLRWITSTSCCLVRWVAGLGCVEESLWGACCLWPLSGGMCIVQQLFFYLFCYFLQYIVAFTQYA